jgi:hypothetical protein
MGNGAGTNEGTFGGSFVDTVQVCVTGSKGEMMCAQCTVDPCGFVKGPIENIEKVRRIYAFDIFKRVADKTLVHALDFTKRGKLRKKQYTGAAKETEEWELYAKRIV